MPEALPPHWAFKLVISFLGFVDKLRDKITPAPVRVLEKGFEFIGSSTIFACCKLNIPDALEPGWNSLASIASKTGLEEEPLARLLKAAHQFGFFELRGQPTKFEVKHNRLSIHLAASQPDSLKPMFDMFYTEVFPQFCKLDLAAQTALDLKAPSIWEVAHGHEGWKYFELNPERAQIFNQAMAAVDTQGVDATLADHNWAQYTRVLDIGGSTGSLVSKVLTVTKASGVVCDQETVIKDAIHSWEKKKSIGDPLAKTSLPRMTFEAIDFFQKDTIPKAKDGDCYIFRCVYHDWDDGKCIDIMRNTRHAFGSAQAVMVIVEMSPTSLTRSPIGTTQQFGDAMMMCAAKGKERSKPQWEHLLSQTGFQLISTTFTRSPFVIWVAKPIP